MRSLLPIAAFLVAGALINPGCMLPNFGNDSGEEESTDATSDSEEKDVPGRDDNSGNDPGNSDSGDDLRTENGTLALGDRTLNSGEYADLYNVRVDQGQTIVVEMRSDEFDPYLILRPPGGATQVDNDDWQGNTNLSRIEYVATQSGNFDVIATSYAVGESGAYRVTMEVGQGIGSGSTDTGGTSPK